MQCYALKGYILEKDVFYELLRGDLLKVGDMNVKVGSDHTLLGHVLGKYGDCHKISWVSADQHRTSNQSCPVDMRRKRDADIGLEMCEMILA